MSETALIVREDKAVVVTPEQMELIKKTIAPDATPAELQLFIYDNTRRGVNPLDKMIHFTKRGGKYTPITGIDFMRTRAAETGEYAGSDDAVFSGEPGKADFAAKVTVYRFVQGQRCPFAATARWSEYYPGDGGVGTLWRKMPHTMLAKCAEALALRKGFPQQISGLYTAEELAQANEHPTLTMANGSTVAFKPGDGDRLRGQAISVDVKPAGPGEDAMFDEPDLGPDPDAAPGSGAVYITKLDKRESIYKSGARKGEKYHQYFIELSDGRKGSFFNGQLGVSAEAAKASKAPVIATFEQQGQYTNLTNLLRAD